MADDTKAQDRPIVTRQEALASGMKWYFTGKPCKYGHIARRNILPGDCMICAAGRTAAHRATHREEHRNYLTKWRAANPEHNYIWRATNHERRRAYKAANKDKAQAYWSSRRARKRGAAGGNYTAADVLVLLKRQRGKCAHPWCRKKISTGYHIDHVMPLIRGGANNRQNIQLLCPTCNLRKGSKHPVDFAQRHGMLI